MAIPSVSSPAVPVIAVAAPLPDTLVLDAATTVSEVGQTASSNQTGLSHSGSQDDRREPAQQASQPLEKALEEINRSFDAWSTQLRFEMDDDAQRLVVTVVDSQTGDTIKTIPSDAVIRVAKMIVSLQGQTIKAEA